MTTTPAPDETPNPQLRCPLCSGLNECAIASPDGVDPQSCWCMTAYISPQALARIPPEQVNRACLCPRCAGAWPRPSNDEAPEVIRGF